MIPQARPTSQRLYPATLWCVFSKCAYESAFQGTKRLRGVGLPEGRYTGSRISGCTARVLQNPVGVYASLFRYAPETRRDLSPATCLQCEHNWIGPRVLLHRRTPDKTMPHRRCRPAIPEDNRRRALPYDLAVRLVSSLRHEE